jgi:hypothetical protein
MSGKRGVDWEKVANATVDLMEARDAFERAFSRSLPDDATLDTLVEALKARYDLEEAKLMAERALLDDMMLN